MQNNQESLVGGVIGKEYLAFTLGDEEYGIDILAVREIRSYEAVTKIANSPEFIKGVINLRGEIVPVIDMRIKFNLDKVLYNEFTVVIVLNVGGQDTGMVVDGVSDVIALTPEMIHAAPSFGSTPATRYITGLGTVDGRMIILVDIEKLMSSNEMEMIASTVS